MKKFLKLSLQCQTISILVPTVLQVSSSRLLGRSLGRMLLLLYNRSFLGVFFPKV